MKKEHKLVALVHQRRARAGSQQDQQPHPPRRLRRRHGGLGRQDHRRIPDDGRLPRQDGAGVAGAHPAAEAACCGHVAGTIGKADAAAAAAAEGSSADRQPVDEMSRNRRPSSKQPSADELDDEIPW